MKINLSELDTVRQRNRTVLSTKTDSFQINIIFRNGSLSISEKENIFDELAILLESGLDIRKSFVLIRENKKSRRQKETLDAILSDITKGHSFSEALTQTGKFSLYDIYSIQIGEESGKLIQVLKDLQVYYEKTVKFNRQIKAALAYPLFILGFSLFAVFIMVHYVIPMFSNVYKRFDSEIPELTKNLLFIVEILNEYNTAILLGMFGIVLVVLTQRRKKWFEIAFTYFVLRLPVIGDIVKKVQLGRFCQSMSLLLGARVALVRSLQLNAQMTEFYPLSNALPLIEKDITKGVSLFMAFKRFSIFPVNLVALVQVGEESNNLPQMFGKMANQYQQEIDNKMLILSRLIEPVLIILLSVIIGFLLVALYLPIFKMGVGIK